MKNLLLVFACAFLFASPGFAQKRVRLLTAADFPRKIAEVTPEAFPWSPKPPRVSSDARDEGLKGKVKGVIEYTFEGKTKEIYREKYYDEDGYMTKQIEYGEGYPESVTVWGFLDGMRVLRSGDIEYKDGEKPPPRAMILSVRAEDNSVDPSRPRDRRYRMRYEYDYDEQRRLIERRSYQNSGELWYRTTYTYEGARRVERDFGNRGDENSKTAETLDANGNVILREMYGADDKVTDPELKEYQFDEKGNWIKELTYEQRTSGKRKVRKLLWTSYRTITYYP